MNFKIYFLPLFIICALCAETIKTNAFSGKVINKTDISNEKLSWRVHYSIDGYQQTPYYGDQYKIFGQKDIISFPDKSGNYAIKPVKLSRHAELSFKENIAFTINYPEEYFVNSMIQNIGSLTFYPSQEYLKVNPCDFELRKQIIQLDFGNFIQAFISIPGTTKHIKFMYEISSDTNKLLSGEYNYNKLVRPKLTNNTFGEISTDFDQNAIRETQKKSLLIFTFIPSKAKKLFERFLIFTELQSISGTSEIMIFSKMQQTELSKLQDTISIQVLNNEILDGLKRTINYRDTIQLFSNAVDSGDVITCRTLFQNGFSPNSLDDLGYPFFIRAIQKSNESVVKEFIGAGVNVNCKSASDAGSYGESALWYALSWMKSYTHNPTTNDQARHIVELLLDNGACDSSLVEEAVRAEYLPALKAIVKQGGNINEQTRGGLSTVLFEAIATGNLEIVRYLVENGADLKLRPTDSSDKETCLEFAKRLENDKVVQYLISMGAQ